MTNHVTLRNRVFDVIRKASRSLIRDFHELDKLRHSHNFIKFAEATHSRVSRILDEELHNSFITNLLPEKHTIYTIPIDGKDNFIRGIPHFAIVVIVFNEHMPILSVVDFPILKETFYSEKAQGMYMQDIANSSRVKVNNASIINGAYIACNIPLNISDISLRCFGCNFLDIVYLASGKFDGFIFKIKKEEDRKMLPVIHFITNEAKGKTSLIHDQYIVASNISIHKALCEKLSK